MDETAKKPKESCQNQAWQTLLLKEEELAVAERLLKIHEQYLLDIKALHQATLDRFEPELTELADIALGKGHFALEKQMTSILTKLHYALAQTEEGLYKLSKEKYRLKEEKGYLSYQRKKLLDQGVN